MFIYMTTNKVNGKKYIGLCTRDDDRYLGSGKLLKGAIKKYGRENFTREIIETCDNFEVLLEREAYWIQFFDAVNSGEFYNLSYGGVAGNSELLKEYWGSMTKEERQTARNWKPHFVGLDQSGEKHISKTDPTWREKNAAGVKRSWDSYTPEEKAARISAARERGFVPKDMSGSKNPMYGRSIVKEKNLKWYNNGTSAIYVTEGTQPAGFVPGRGKGLLKRKKTNAAI